MKKPATGTGSTLVVLVFTVLCLTIFMLMSLSATRIDRAMADKEAQMVSGYYEADFLAECILAEMSEMAETADIPASINGIDVFSGNGIASFSCPITDSKELYVEAAIFGNDYDILVWQMRDTDEWETDLELPVWSGD